MLSELLVNLNPSHKTTTSPNKMSNKDPLPRGDNLDILLTTPIHFTSEHIDLTPRCPRPKPRTTWSMYEIWTRLQTILSEGPSAPFEWWIHELAKYAANDADALYFTFHLPTLQLGFRMLKAVWPPGSLNFLADMEHLLPLLPIREGEQVQRKVLVELVIQAGRELEMDWCDNMRDRAAVLFGLTHACMIQRRREELEGDDGVSAGLEEMELGRDDGAVLNRLADDLVDTLKVKV